MRRPPWIDIALLVSAANSPDAQDLGTALGLIHLESDPERVRDQDPLSLLARLAGAKRIDRQFLSDALHDRSDFVTQYRIGTIEHDAQFFVGVIIPDDGVVHRFSSIARTSSVV